MKSGLISGLFAICMMASGCGHVGWQYVAVPDVRVTQPDPTAAMGPLVLAVANMPGSAAPKDAVKPRTVLVGTTATARDQSADRARQTLVVAIEGSPRPGTFWLTPDNSLLMNYSAWSRPNRTRVGLVGSINIISVSDTEIVAEVSVRDTSEVDQFRYLDRPWDPVTWQPPLLLTGRHTFHITTAQDPLFEKAAIKWVYPEQTASR